MDTKTDSLQALLIKLNAKTRKIFQEMDEEEFNAFTQALDKGKLWMGEAACFHIKEDETVVIDCTPP